MSRIKVKKPSPEELESLEVDNWSHWECQVSSFDWEYPCDEKAYILEGKVRIETESGQIEIKKGDLVYFPRGLKCTWNVIEPIRKVYKFE